MGKDIQKEMRKQMFDQIEADLQKRCKPEKRMFSLHPDEEHIIVSHALFLMMSKPLADKLPSLKGFYLLRKFEEEMLTAYLTESDEYPELLRYCNLLYDMFPYELAAAGYGGDMEDDTVDDILDDLDFERNNKVCSHVIEQMMPQLNELVKREKIY